MIDKDDKICRQLKKYVVLYETQFIDYCDDEKMILMCLNEDLEN